MSQAPDWNTSAPVQAIPPIPAQAVEQPQYGPPDSQSPDSQSPDSQQPQYGQVDPGAAMAPGAYPLPGMTPRAPAGLYYDEISGLNLPQGTMLASVGRRIGAYFLGALLAVVTLGLGYLIWGLIAWSKGQTPAQQVLGLQTWKPQEQVNATWGTMFRRGLAWAVLGIVPFGQIVSFFLFVSGREHRALHDSMTATIVLSDPEKVLRPVPGA